jgi:hypothetical protein
MTLELAVSLRPARAALSPDVTIGAAEAIVPIHFARGSGGR